MKRFFFIRYCLLIAATTVVAQDKPNILWITIEDTSPQFIGCYDNPDASTPVIDRLAKEGVRFTNAFSTGTVCAPSRSTIITGVPTYKMGTGHQRSNYPIPDFIHGFPYYLKQEGYYTSNNSKTDYNIANEKTFIADAWDESSGKAGWENREPGQSFFSVFNFAEPHQSRTMSMPFDWYVQHVWDHLPTEDRIVDNAFVMPPIYRDTPEMRKQFARVYNSIKLTDNRIGDLLQKLETDGLREETIIFFYADHGEGMPRGKTNGIDYGYRVPFVIWFPEKYKHLSPWGTNGVVTNELINFEDLAPTMINLIGGTVPEYLKGRVFMGKNRSEESEFRLLSSDRVNNGPDLVRTITNGRYIYSRNFMPYVPQMRYIRYVEIADITKHMRNDLKNEKLDSLQRSFFKPRPAEFLFDIEKDLWETKNLAEDPEYKEMLEKMRTQLDKKLLEARDVLFLPEYEIGLLSQTTTPYEYRLDKEKYPFKKIFEVASLSGKRGSAVAQKQVKFLKDNNKIIRYWAAVGLRSQPLEVVLPFEKEITKAIYDPYPPVAITNAFTAYEFFKNSESVDVLKNFAKSKNIDLALMTINYLAYLSDKEPFIETIQQLLEVYKDIYDLKSACEDFLNSIGIATEKSKIEH